MEIKIDNIYRKKNDSAVYIKVLKIFKNDLVAIKVYDVDFNITWKMKRYKEDIMNHYLKVSKIEVILKVPKLL